MSVKLVAIDLDDTLLDSGLKISPACVAAIEAVREKGVLVTLATGRMFQSALRYARQLEMDIPLITYQGALVKNSRSDEVLYYKPVPADMTIEVMDYFKREGVHYQAYFNDQLYMESHTEEGKYYCNLAGVEAVMVKDLIETSRENETMKVLAITENESLLLEMEIELRNMFGKKLNVTRSKPFFLEVMDHLANKADALQVVAQHYNIDRKEVMAVGDSYNDLAMIEWAGIGVAMGNARDAVKEAAEFITASNDEEGVAEALKRFVLL